ncbi:ABC transporter ATP-binding protein [Alkalicella caledoniensis]|uniref:ABC transporter ATP-binding protein n=1 Tax=Alkalicella caledoniensis TaxID=2731377 RepID=A0A7G9W6L5_ALKCA|nr:ABC transporter ATP-binding protein [Alkalicella caledoniensis]QNO14327.1 ABC transporter ATP-binding protein [Alkalicella caledoniensis]
MSILKLENISYTYDGLNKVLAGVNYEFLKGKVYAIVGRSGAGKTTLLSLLSGLTSPTEGRILFEDKDVRNIDRYQYRSRYVGVVFQQFNLLPHLNAVENVELSMRASGKKIENKRKRATDLLDKVDLDEALAKRRVLKLSGGEQQRVAIARALSFDPDIVLADEPTGNLDLTTQEDVMDIFKRLAHEENKCVIIVTHSPEVAASVDEVYELASFRKTVKRRNEH